MSEMTMKELLQSKLEEAGAQNIGVVDQPFDFDKYERDDAYRFGDRPFIVILPTKEHGFSAANLQCAEGYKKVYVPFGMFFYIAEVPEDSLETYYKDTTQITKVYELQEVI